MIGLAVFLSGMLVIVTFDYRSDDDGGERYLPWKQVTAGSALSAAWRKAWTLLKTQFIVGLIVAVGFVSPNCPRDPVVPFLCSCGPGCHDRGI